MKKEKIGTWFPEKIEGEELQDIADWLNGWGNFNDHKECSVNHKFTDFGRGYQKAISDVIEKLDFDLKLFDKRTKTGFK